MKNPILMFLEKTELVIATAIILPLILAVEVSGIKTLIEILLGIVMFLSLRPFFGKRFDPKSGFIELAMPLVISYGLLSLAYILLGYLFFGTSHNFFIGYVLIAITPPAVSIIPFCYISRCDHETADIPVFTAFMLTLVIIPATLFALYGKTIDTQALAKILIIVLVIPSFLAYKLSGYQSRIFNYSKAAINLCLGAVIFISMSLNRTIFLDFSRTDVLYVYMVNTLVIFGIGLAVYYTSKKVFPDDAIAHSFYGSQKNVATAITLGIVLFHPDAAVPAIIAMALQFIYFIFFKHAFVMREQKQDRTNKRKYQRKKKRAKK